MIKNEKQLKVTKEKIEDLKASLLMPFNSKAHPNLQKTAEAQIKELINSLEKEVSDYLNFRKTF